MDCELHDCGIDSGQVQRTVMMTMTTIVQLTVADLKMIKAVSQQHHHCSFVMIVTFWVNKVLAMEMTRRIERALVVAMMVG